MKKIFLIFFVFVLQAQALAYGDTQMTASAASDRISLDIKGMDIIDVLKMLSAKTELNLVIDKNVAGRVTVFLKDVMPGDALDVILASNDLVQQKQAGITRIMTGQDYEQRFGSDKVFRRRYSDG